MYYFIFVDKSKPKGKNTDKIDTYMDTSNNIPITYPRLLVNRKLKSPKKSLEINNPDYYHELSNYINSYDPKYLLRAIKLNNEVMLAGMTQYINFRFDETGKYKNLKRIKYFEDYIIVWESI